MGCSTGIAKLLMFIFNGTFFLFGLIVMVAGILLIVLPNKTLELVSIAAKESSDSSHDAILSNSMPLVHIIAIIFIVIGVFTLIVGFCGCCGAVRESSCLLTIYAVCIGIILVVEIGAAIAGIIFKGKIRNAVTKELWVLENKYYVNYKKYNETPSTQNKITLLVNYLQVSLRCCGVNTANDIANSESWLNSDPKHKGQKMVTPLTCCQLKMTPDAFFAAGAKWSDFFMNPDNYLKDSDCPTTGKAVHPISCYDELESEVNKYAVAIIAIGIVLALIEFIGIVIACCLMRSDGYN